MSDDQSQGPNDFFIGERAASQGKPRDIDILYSMDFANMIPDSGMAPSTPRPARRMRTAAFSMM